MTILMDVIKELAGMFVGDARLSMAVLIVVAVSAGLAELTSIDPLICGGVLLFGCLATVIESVRRAARREAK